MSRPEDRTSRQVTEIIKALEACQTIDAVNAVAVKNGPLVEALAASPKATVAVRATHIRNYAALRRKHLREQLAEASHG